MVRGGPSLIRHTTQSRRSPRCASGAGTIRRVKGVRSGGGGWCRGSDGYSDGGDDGVEAGA